MLQVSITGNVIRDIAAPDINGARSVMIAPRPVPEFIGTLQDAITYLEAEPIGRSVNVTYRRNGEFAGARSCMNKPALWQDMRDRLV
jgi:hypothetical protein